MCACVRVCARACARVHNFKIHRNFLEKTVLNRSTIGRVLNRSTIVRVEGVSTNNLNYIFK